MKTFFKIVLFPLTLALLFSCKKEHPAVPIPDELFLKALIEQGVDANGDVIISPFEAEKILSINVDGYGISEMMSL